MAVLDVRDVAKSFRIPDVHRTTVREHAQAAAEFGAAFTTVTKPVRTRRRNRPMCAACWTIRRLKKNRKM